jgi:hypothetical protein
MSEMTQNEKDAVIKTMMRYNAIQYWIDEHLAADDGGLDNYIGDMADWIMSVHESGLELDLSNSEQEDKAKDMIRKWICTKLAGKLV